MGAGLQLVRCGPATVAPAAPAPRPSLLSRFITCSSGQWPCWCSKQFRLVGGGGGGGGLGGGVVSRGGRSVSQSVGHRYWMPPAQAIPANVPGGGWGGGGGSVQGGMRGGVRDPLPRPLWDRVVKRSPGAGMCAGGQGARPHARTNVGGTAPFGVVALHVVLVKEGPRGILDEEHLRGRAEEFVGTDDEGHKLKESSAEGEGDATGPGTGACAPRTGADGLHAGHPRGADSPPPPPGDVLAEDTKGYCTQLTTCQVTAKRWRLTSIFVG